MKKVVDTYELIFNPRIHYYEVLKFPYYLPVGGEGERVARISEEDLIKYILEKENNI